MKLYNIISKLKKAMSEKNGNNENCRRGFLKKSLALGIGTLGCNGVLSSCSTKKN